MKLIRLKELRKGARMSQQELADRMSVSRSAVAMWERGTEPSNEMLQSLADCFGVSVDFLLGRDGAAPSDGRSVEVDDEELWEIREELRRRPEMRVLFSATKKATKEDLLRAIKIIEALKEDSGNE